MKTIPVYLRLLKTSVTVLFWFTVLFFGLAGLYMVKFAKVDGSHAFAIVVPYIVLDHVPPKIVEGSGRHLTIGNTGQARINVYYPDEAHLWKDWVRHFGPLLLLMLMLVALTLTGLWQVKRIFDTLGTPDVFSSANVRRIRVIACLMISCQLLPAIVWLFFQSDITALLDAHKIRYSNNLEFGISPLLITGVLLFGLAEVFRSGFQLRQEQDLTI